MCSECARAGAGSPNQQLLAKLSPQERDVMQRTLEEFRGVLRDWHDDLLSALRAAGVDVSSAGSARAAVREAFDPHRESFDLTIEDMHTEGAQAGRAVAIQRYALDISYEITRPEVLAALRENADEASNIVSQRMTGDLADALADAHNQGLGIDEITDILEEEVFPDARDWEARRVARTEVISASNKGAHEAYVDAGAPREEWIASLDGDTRDSHRAANGQVVLTTEPFIVGGQQAQHPGDMSLPVRERANCRCTVAPVFDD